MKAEIIAIGTELLLGQIVNTNAQYLAQACAGMGINVYYQTVVGDNAERIRRALETARSRADLIICTGGLGPTQDDLTKDVLASFLGKGLYLHQPSMDKIQAIFQARGVHMVESNKRQALMIEDAVPLPNETGLAVGLAISAEGTHYMLLPGPPREMKPMFDQYGIEWLRSILPSNQPLFSVMLKFAGIGESSLEHELIDLIKNQQDPTIAPYAKEGEVTIRLTTRAETLETAIRKMKPTEMAIRERVGQYLYATEDISIEEAVVRLLADQGRTLAVAESCSGGLLSHLITSVPGSSSVFRGGIVCYTNEVKHRLLSVPSEVLEGNGAPGAVSEETAMILADNALHRLDSDFALSVTGVAGPGESEGKPVGLVYVGVAQKGKPARSVKLMLSGGRNSIKLRASKQALYELWKLLARPSQDS